MFPANAVSLVRSGVTNEFDMISCGYQNYKIIGFLSA